ncbi:Uncharacterized protein BM_BM17482 [Brugia malayi]|uniref:Uncharacterized protein n=1 Tax=Brugia malayi TaxID=6279 RepID=A0A4E9FAQ0_BRUMA|nr:Uncharacterized protein BM_BM17482 [Brugia malayi]VIO93268.1 Uncharacterized protein BM_BM17482 [Brugia malayi]
MEHVATKVENNTTTTVANGPISTRNVNRLLVCISG